MKKYLTTHPVYVCLCFMKIDLEKIHNKLTALGFVKYGWIHYHEPPLLIYHYDKIEPEYMTKDTLMMIISPEEDSAILRNSTDVESMIECKFPKE